MIVYSQKIKDGIPRLCYGEDVLPYDKDGILLVADGLGGRGGFEHTTIKTAFSDKDGVTPLNHYNFYDAVFGAVLGDEGVEVTDEFKFYATKCFDEFLELVEADKYFENPKTSGYFASRLASVISLYHIKFNPKFNADDLFENVIGKSEEEQQGIINEYAESIAAVLKEYMRRVAEWWRLELQTKIVGAYLLPSTINIALVKEVDNELHVVYLWAGDSRAYYWDKKSGLCQITDDHEEGETMYNLVNLTTGGFKFEARYLKFNKPCVLFNATDGCYKCSCYSAPINMEMSLLDQIEHSVSFDDLSKNLCSLYKNIGRHDDSSTMAFNAYGYGEDARSSYAALKEAAAERIDVINDLMKDLPDILEVDYNAIEEELENRKEAYLRSKSNEWIALDGVVDFIKHLVVMDKYPPYLEALAKHQERVRAEMEKEAQNDVDKNEIETRLLDIWNKIFEWLNPNLSPDKDHPYKYEDEERFADDFICGKIKAKDVFKLDDNSHPNIRAELIEMESQLKGCKAALPEDDGYSFDAIVTNLAMRYWRVKKGYCLNEIMIHREEVLKGTTQLDELNAELQKERAEAGDLLEKLNKRDRIYDVYNNGYYKYHREAQIK